MLYLAPPLNHHFPFVGKDTFLFLTPQHLHALHYPLCLSSASVLSEGAGTLTESIRAGDTIYLWVGTLIQSADPN